MLLPQGDATYGKRKKQDHGQCLVTEFIGSCKNAKTAIDNEINGDEGEAGGERRGYRARRAPVAKK